MRKLTIFGIIFLIFAAGIIFILLNLSSIVNKNKQILLARAEKVLQRKISVDDVKVSLWGGVGILLKGITVSDEPTFSSGDFLQASSLQVNVQILPLLRKELQVKKIILYDPVISIIRNEKGLYNFETLAGKKEERKESLEPAAPEKPSLDEERTPFLFLVSLINIRNGEVRYMDKTPDGYGQIKVRGLDLKIGSIGFEHPITINLSAKLLDAEEKNITLKGSLGPLGYQVDLAKIPVQGKIQLGPLNFDKLTKAFPRITKQIPPGIGIRGPLKLQADVTGTGKALRLSNIDLRASVFDSKEANLKIKKGEIGPLGPEKSFQDLKINAHIELSPVNLEKLRRFPSLQKALPAQLKAGGDAALMTDVSGSLQKLNVVASLEATQAKIELGNDLQKASGVPLTISLKCQIAGQKTTCQDFHFRFHQLEGKGLGKIRMGKVPSVDISIKTNKTDLAGWEQIVSTLKDYALSGTVELEAGIAGPVSGKKIPSIQGKIDLTNVNAHLPQLGRSLGGIHASLRLNGDTLAMQDATLTWGSSPLKVTARVKNFASPKITYEFSSPELKLTDFLNPDSTSKVVGDVLREVNSQGKIEAAGQKFRYRGMITVGRGTIHKIDYQNIQSTLSFANQVATIEKLHFEALGGSFQGYGKYSFQDSKNPLFDFSSKIVDMDLKKLLVAASDLTQETLVGKLRLVLQVGGRGEQWKTIQHTLGGKGKFGIKDGALVNINLPEIVLSKITGVPGLSALISTTINSKYAHLFEAKDTKFEHLKGSFLINNGKIQIKDLILAAADYTIQANGWVGLDKKIDLSANLVMAQEFSKDVMDEMKEAQYIANEENRLEFPFRITGQVPHIVPKPDVAHLRKKLQKALLQKGVEKLLEKVLPPRKKKDSTPEAEQAPGSSREPQPPEKPEDIIQKALEDLFGR